jgi:hypothetical protein
MIKLLLGPTLGVTLFFFLSYYQPMVETTSAQERVVITEHFVSPIPFDLL